MYLCMSLVCVCGQEMWTRNVPVMWQLSTAAALGSFFPITFTLRQVHVSDKHKFPMHSSLFSLEWFVLAVVIWDFLHLGLVFPWRICLSVLSHPSLAVKDSISFCSALPPSPWTPAHWNAHPSLFMELFPDFPSFILLPRATSSPPSNINLVWWEQFPQFCFYPPCPSSCSFFSLSIKLVTSDSINNILSLNISGIMLDFIIMCFCLIPLWFCFRFFVLFFFLPLTDFFQGWSIKCSSPLTYSHFSVFLTHISFFLSPSIDFLLWLSLLQDPKWHWPSLLPSGCLIHTQHLHVPLCSWIEQKTLCVGKWGWGNCTSNIKQNTIYPHKYAVPTWASQN